jgi:hypothetical protein
MTTQSTITVRFAVVGFHYWPGAPKHRAYLSTPHRHLFGVTVRLEVFADDREVEFHDLQQWTREAFGEGDFGGNSCEALARALLEKICDRYPGRYAAVSVDEDGECEATVALRS